MHYCIMCIYIYIIYIHNIYVYIITKLFKKESVIWNTDILNFNILVVSHAHRRKLYLIFVLYINLFYLNCPVYFTKEQYVPLSQHSCLPRTDFTAFFLMMDQTLLVRFNELIPCQFIMLIIASPSPNTVFVR